MTDKNTAIVPAVVEATVVPVEVKPTVVAITLTDSQVEALKKLGLMDELNDLVKNAATTAIKGKFKYYADKAEAETGKSYDWAIRSGAKFDKDRGAFVSGYMFQLREILKNL